MKTSKLPVQRQFCRGLVTIYKTSASAEGLWRESTRPVTKPQNHSFLKNLLPGQSLVRAESEDGRENSSCRAWALKEEGVEGKEGKYKA